MPTLSVEGFQVSDAEVKVTEAAVRPSGVEGFCRSPIVAALITLLLSDTFPAAS